MRSSMQTFLGGVTGALTVIVLMGASGGLGLLNEGIQFPDGTLQTTAAAADPRRAFYLTSSSYLPGGLPGPLDACAPGFHMASLWEILDVSTLRYATDDEGGLDVQRRLDSGFGPPSGVFGWVRTGYTFSASAGPGRGNCAVWSDTILSGTAVALEHEWVAATGTGDPPLVIAPWDAVTVACSSPLKVWCVAD